MKNSTFVDRKAILFFVAVLFSVCSFAQNLKETSQLKCSIASIQEELRRTHQENEMLKNAQGIEFSKGTDFIVCGALVSTIPTLATLCNQNKSVNNKSWKVQTISAASLGIGLVLTGITMEAFSLKIRISPSEGSLIINLK